jgi:N-methylhydantoinase A
LTGDPDKVNELTSTKDWRCEENCLESWKSYRLRAREPAGMTYRVGVDIGGTFTDFCVLGEASGDIRTLKVLSRPDQPGAEVMEGLKELERRYGIRPAEISYFTHGTTVGVNTVIQRRGVALALFTTEGFEDVLEVARLKMPDPYDLFSRRPEPLSPRERVFGIRERVLADGTVDTPVDAGSVVAAIDRAKADGAQAVVVAFLHSYANAANERRVRELILERAPEMSITLSSEVWPVIREYERTVTATVAGYVQARVATYLSTWQAALKDAGVACEPMITKSNGGVMRAELGKTAPIQMLLSGTASGVIGASRIAEQTGVSSVLSFDVGGTSADVAIIHDGKPAFGTGERVGDFQIHIPTVSVSSIGAGGGSIARVDEFNVLKVGPESAGSNPGPACHGRGGTNATITDAYAVCGFLGSGDLGYGAVTLDLARARQAVGEIACKLGMGTEEAAEAIIKVSVSGMFLEISKLFSRHGADPRHFALLPFGGAGPMTACLLARDLGLGRIIVPPTPGVLAAFGGLVADIRNDFIRTAFVDLSAPGLAEIKGHAKALAQQARTWLTEEQKFKRQAHLQYSADMRYRGQSYEIEVPLEEAWIEAGDLRAIGAAFHAEHERVYEHADEKARVQIVNLRLVASGASPQPKMRRAELVPRAATPVSETRVFYDGAHVAAGIYDRDKLMAGEWFTGPAVVRQSDCTTCLVGGFKAAVDEFSNLIITRDASSS